MAIPVHVSEVSRSLVVRPAVPLMPPAVVRAYQVIDVDVRRQPLGARGGTRAREAVTRYGDHGTALLGPVPGHDPGAPAGAHEAADGWMLVGRWLTLVAVLSVFAVAFALYGNHAAG